MIKILPIEWLEASPFVHTLQLTKAEQGGTMGSQVLDFLLQQAADKNVLREECRSVAGNPVLALYRRLGFKVSKGEGVLIGLRLDLEECQSEVAKQSGDYWRTHISTLRC